MPPFGEVGVSKLPPRKRDGSYHAGRRAVALARIPSNDGTYTDIIERMERRGYHVDVNTPAGWVRLGENHLRTNRDTGAARFAKKFHQLLNQHRLPRKRPRDAHQM